MRYFPYFFCGIVLMLGLFSTAPETIAQAAATVGKPVKEPVTVVEKSIDLPHRIRLHYAEQGSPAGEPVIFLHGYTDSWHSYETVLKHLPLTVHAFALSQRGHGNSEKPLQRYQPADFAADIAAFMQQLKIKKAVIVGHSMGSIVAQRFAIDYPGQTKGIVLMGAFASISHNEGARQVYDAVMQLQDPVDTVFINEFQKSTLAKPIDADYFKRLVKESEKLPASIWKSVLQGLMDADFTSELTKIDKPALIVWGDKDAICTRKDQDELLAAIKGSSLKIYNGTGHGVHWEEPKRFAGDLISFINRTVD